MHISWHLPVDSPEADNAKQLHRSLRSTGCRLLIGGQPSGTCDLLTRPHSPRRGRTHNSQQPPATGRGRGWIVGRMRCHRRPRPICFQGRWWLNRWRTGEKFSRRGCPASHWDQSSQRSQSPLGQCFLEGWFFAGCLRINSKQLEKLKLFSRWFEPWQCRLLWISSSKTKFLPSSGRPFCLDPRRCQTQSDPLLPAHIFSLVGRWRHRLQTSLSRFRSRRTLLRRSLALRQKPWL